jgi:hypothetical protein
MGMYVEAFLMPPTLDHVVHHATTYRTYFWLTYGEADGVTKISLPRVLFKNEDLPWQDNEHAYIMSVDRYLELAQQFRDKMDAERSPEEASDGPTYVDDMTEWLEHGKPWDDFVIVLVPEE